MTVYMAFLKEHAQVTERCRPLSRAYLACRMERGLMAEEELSKARSTRRSVALR